VLLQGCVKANKGMFMKLFFTALFVSNLFFLGSALANSSPAQLLRGSWGLTDLDPSNDIMITVRKHSLTVTEVCTHGDQMMKAKVTVPASYTDQQITVLKTGLKTEYSPDHSVACNAYIRMGFSNYSIQGNQMTWTDSESPDAPLTFVRRGY
jgi:hypothetical protein